MDIIGEFLDGDGSCADNTGKRILTACNRVEKTVSSMRDVARERRRRSLRGVCETGRRELRGKSKEGGSGGGRRNAYHWLQPHRPSDPYLWSPSGVGVVHTTYFTPGPRDTELTLLSVTSSSSFPPRKSKLNVADRDTRNNNA